MRPLTVFGVTALTFMLVMYSLERRNAGSRLRPAARCRVRTASRVGPGRSAASKPRGLSWPCGAGDPQRMRYTDACRGGAGERPGKLTDRGADRRQRTWGSDAHVLCCAVHDQMSLQVRTMIVGSWL
jgi:hypothetical protein